MPSPGFLSSWEASRVLEWSTLLVLQTQKIENHYFKKHFHKLDWNMQKYFQMFSLLVVSLPELDGTDIGGDEDGTAQEGVEGSGEDCRDNSLDK